MRTFWSPPVTYRNRCSLSGEKAMVTAVPVGVLTSRATKASVTNVPSGLNTWSRLFDRSAM